MRRLTFLSLLLCCAVLAFPELTCQWKDGFVDNRSSWNVAEDAYGKLAIQNGRLLLTAKQASGSWGLVPLGFDRARDFRVTARMGQAPYGQRAGYGIIWELSDPGNYSAFLIASGGAWAVMRTRGGKAEFLQPWAKTPYLNDDGDDLLAVSRQGGRLGFSANGNELGSLPVQDGGGSYLGFLVGGAGELSADYLSVYLEHVYQGSTMGPPSGAVLTASEEMGADTSAWPLGNVGGTLTASRGVRSYALAHTGRNRSDIVTRRVDVDPSRDFTLEAALTKVAGDDDTAYGMVFDRSGDDRWVFALAGVGQYTVYRFEGGKRMDVQAWTRSPDIHKFEGTNVLSVSRTGDLLSFGVNGRLLASTAWVPWTSSEVGFSVGGDLSVEVTRLQAWRLPPAKGAVSGNCADGWGTSVLDGGAWYIGSWKGGLPDGLGTRYWPDGRIEEGLWERGNLKPGAVPESGPVFYPVAAAAGGPWGFADAAGKLVVPVSIMGSFYNLAPLRGLAYAQAGARLGYVDAAGRRLADPSWAASGPFAEGLAMVYTAEGRAADGERPRGFIDSSGVMAIEPGRYTYVLGDEEFALGLCRVKDAATKRYGFVGRDGSVAVPALLRNITRFSEGLCVATHDGVTFGYMERTGRWRIAPRFTAAQDFHEGLAYVVEQDGTHELIDQTGAVAFTSRHALTDSTTLYNTTSRFSEGLVAYRDSETRLWGYMDRKGSAVTRGVYWVARPFSEGLAAINLKGTWIRESLNLELIGGWGFLDRTGRVVIPCAFESVGDFVGGIAPARAEKKWGYIDTRGTWVISPTYDRADSFRADGLARVTLGKAVTWIDRTGKAIWKP